MDTTDHHHNALGMRGPYDDDIDIGWVERRLNDRAGSRSSRLSAYFEGVMEFVEPPPTISRSPSPEPHHQAAWQASPRYSHSVRPSLDHSFQRRSSGKGIPRIPSRRSTLESDSDSATGMPPRRRRRRYIATMFPDRTDAVFRICNPKSCAQPRLFPYHTNHKAIY
jgi:hypothetical protein